MIKSPENPDFSLKMDHLGPKLTTQTGVDPHWGFGGVATPPKILGNFRKFWEILNFLER